MSKPYTIDEAKRLKQAMVDVTTILNDHPAMDSILEDVPEKLKDAIEWIVELEAKQ